MSLDSIKNTRSVKPKAYRPVNIKTETYDKMKQVCVELQSTHNAFLELAINNLIEEYERRTAE
jgi:hypothetical protein|tara:strand:- start:6 stop:194 length:189 start_codon:yes stop_codon:yes gene_type:complete